MRVLQIIDSLHPGGAERIAVNFANALVDKIEFSGIVVTREEGFLKKNLNNNVPYFFINKKSTFDIASLLRLKTIIKKNKIDILHAHGTSFFTATLIKIFYFQCKIVFHEHNGGRANQTFFKNIPLLFCGLFFSKILVVNRQIHEWYNLKGYKKNSYFPNFATLENDKDENTILFGEPNKRIICLANLKNPKNHLILLKAFHKSKIESNGWSLHLVGKNYNDIYLENLNNLINEFSLQKSVFLYDSKSDIKNILEQSTIGVLSSSDEGFPVTLLEYGLAKLPVICSDVGFCSEIIKDKETGLLFNPSDDDNLALNLVVLTNNFDDREKYKRALFNLINLNFNKDKIIADLILIYTNMNENS